MISYPVPAPVLFQQYVGPPDSFLDVLPILTPDYRPEIVVRDRKVAVHSNTNRR